MIYIYIKYRKIFYLIQKLSKYLRIIKNKIVIHFYKNNLFYLKI